MASRESIQLRVVYNLNVISRIMICVAISVIIVCSLWGQFTCNSIVTIHIVFNFFYSFHVQMCAKSTAWLPRLVCVVLSSSHFMLSAEFLLFFFCVNFLFIRRCLHCSRGSIQCEIVCLACPLPGASRKSHESCDSLIRAIGNYLRRVRFIWNRLCGSVKILWI